MQITSLCTAKFTNSYIQKKNKNNEISVNQPALNFKANTLAIRKNNLLKILLFTVGLLLTSIVPSESNKNRNSELLISAVENNDINSVKLLCKYGNIDINRRDKQGHTALTDAAYMGRKEILQELLKRDDINVNLQDKWGNTALIKAADNGSLAIVQELLKQKDIDVNLKTNENLSALTGAAYNGQLAIVKELLKRDDVDVNLQDQCGNTALLNAMDMGKWEVVKELLTRDDIDVNQQDNNGNTALILAVHKGRLDIVQELLKRDDIDVNQQVNNGDTALIRAARNNKLDIVQELLKHEKIDPYLKDNDGKTAMDINSEVKNIVQEMEDRISREAYEKLNINDADLYNTSTYLKILNSEITPNGLATLFNKKQNNGPDSLLCKLASYPMIDENNENEFKEILSKLDELDINYNQKDENEISVFEYVLNSENKIFLEFLIKKGAKFDYYSNLDDRYKQITDKDFKTLLDEHKYELVDFKDVRDAIKSENPEAKKAIEPQTKSPFFYSPDYMYIL